MCGPDGKSVYDNKVAAYNNFSIGLNRVLIGSNASSGQQRSIATSAYLPKQVFNPRCK